MAQEPAWRKRTKTERGVGRTLRTIKNTFLIYCEGESTEPNYFKAFPITTETKVETIGTGRSKTALVEFAFKDLKKINKIDKDPDRQVWVVFDFDRDRTKPNQKQDFNNAIQLAKRHKMKVAYSNDCFELWFWLHFQYTDVQMHRTQLYELLSKQFGPNYEKIGKTANESMKLYTELLPKQEKAIKNAQKLFETMQQHEEEKENPVTTVFQLVQELNKYLRV